MRDRFLVVGISAFLMTVCVRTLSAGSFDEPELAIEDDASCVVKASVPEFPGSPPPAAGGNVCFCVGGTVRGRYEYFQNEGWSSAFNDDDGYLLSRVHLHGDLRVGPIRVFTQFQSALSEGRTGGPGPIDEDRLDLHQGFASWFVTRDRGEERIEVRVGRQEIQYGSARLLSARAGANTKQAFEGAVAIMQAERRRADVFWLAPVETNPGEFDNKPSSGRVLAGAYLTLSELAGGINLDAYVLGTRVPDRAFVGASGPERRATVGLRLWERRGAWDYDIEVVGQFGTFGDETIRAWTAASDVGRTFEAVPWRPRLGIKTSVASGDNDPADGTRGTFNPLYPRAAYFGEISQVGPANILNLHPSLTVSPAENLSLTVDAVFFWRHRLEDGIYGPNLGLGRAPGGSSARHIGNQYDLLLSWRIKPDLMLEASAAWFTAGRFVEETGPARTVRYANLTLIYTF